MTEMTGRKLRVPTAGDRQMWSRLFAVWNQSSEVYAADDPRSTSWAPIWWDATLPLRKVMIRFAHEVAADTDVDYDDDTDVEYTAHCFDLETGVCIGCQQPRPHVSCQALFCCCECRHADIEGHEPPL